MPVNEITNMNNLSLFLHDETETVAIGQQLGALMTAGGTVFLTGTLGAGKTTLTRGLLKSFGHSGAVKSPTYTLVEPYEFEAPEDLGLNNLAINDSAINNAALNPPDRDGAGKQVVYHFDLYRLADPEELEYMGIREYFDSRAICIVEWPEKGQGFLPKPDIELSLHPSKTGRALEIKAHTPKGSQLLDQFQKSGKAC